MKYLPDLYDPICISKNSSNDNDVGIAEARMHGAIEMARLSTNRDISIANLNTARDITVARINASMQKTAILGNTLSSVMSSIPWQSVEPPSSVSVVHRKGGFFCDWESMSIYFKK